MLFGKYFLKILHHDFGRHAFPVQLSRTLAERGHEVLHLYAASNNTPMGNLARAEGDPTGFTCRAIHTRSEYQKYSFIKRWAQEQEYAGLLAEEIRQYQPDAVIECTGPTDGHRAALRASRQAGARYIYWLQDINGLAASKILKNKVPVVGGLVGDYYLRMEKDVLRGCDETVLISEDFKPILKEWGIGEEKQHVIPNWAPLDLLPERPRVNEWSQSHGLAGKFVYLYSGSLGLKHKPELFLELARHFETRSDVQIVVISEGLGAEWLKQECASHGIKNLTVLGYQPFESMADVSASADVLVGVLQPDAGGFSVPSKVNTYLCAGRPILLAIPAENLAARLIRTNEAGLTVDPADTAGFLRAADELFHSAERRQVHGANARRYAETHFNIQQICDQFEQILAG